MRTAANRTIIAAVRNHNICFKDKYLTTENIAINPKIELRTITSGISEEHKTLTMSAVKTNYNHLNILKTNRAASLRP